ncbi:MAG: PilZ domain-containing protein [Myxococcales bacterium]|nr:PilZ domain-containing protein [Myxococcales bacterium]
MSLEVDVDVTSGSNFYAGKTRDVSVGGIFIELPVAPEVGTDIGLKLTLGSRQFSVIGRCTWVLSGQDGEPVGFGAEFVGLLPGVKKAIETFMIKRDPLDFELIEDDEPPLSKRGPPPLPRRGAHA